MNVTKDQAIAHYEKQKRGLEVRLEITRASIGILDQDWGLMHIQRNPDGLPTVELKMLSAIIKAQLLQLHAARGEGEMELAIINEAIKKLSSPLTHATIIPPTGVAR